MDVARNCLVTGNFYEQINGLEWAEMKSLPGLSIPSSAWKPWRNTSLVNTLATQAHPRTSHTLGAQLYISWFNISSPTSTYLPIPFKQMGFILEHMVVKRPPKILGM